jgi:hypothetical protein
VDLGSGGEPASFPERRPSPGGFVCLGIGGSRKALGAAEGTGWGSVGKALFVARNRDCSTNERGKAARLTRPARQRLPIRGFSDVQLIVQIASSARPSSGAPMTSRGRPGGLDVDNPGQIKAEVQVRLPNPGPARPHLGGSSSTSSPPPSNTASPPPSASVQTMPTPHVAPGLDNVCGRARFSGGSTVRLGGLGGVCRCGECSLPFLDA